MKNKNYVYLASLGHLAVDTAQGTLPALLPLFVSTYGLNYQQAAGLMFASTALSSVLQPLFGWLADKKPMQWLIPLGVVLTGLSIAAMGWADSYRQLFLCAMAGGVGAAVFHPEAARLVNRISAPEQRGKMMGIFAVGGSAGFATGPMLAGLAYWWGPHALGLFVVTNLILAAIIYVVVPNMAVKAPTTTATQSRNDWKSFGILSVPIMARSIHFSVLNTFIPLYWVYILKQPEAAGNFALTIFFSVGVVVTLIGGMWSDKIGSVRVLRYANWLLLPSVLLFAWNDHVWLATALLLPLGFGVASQYSPMVILGQQYLAKSIGFAGGITLGLGFTIGGIFSPLIGWFADHYGLPAALQILSLVTVVSLLFAYRLRMK